MTISLLPDDFIENEFNTIVNNTDDNLKESLKELFEYYKANWIDKLGPSEFSLYQQVAAINDVSVIHWRVLEQKLQFNTNPDIWKFLGIVY